MERADKAIREKDELTFLLKEQKAINADQAVELKKEKQINKAFKKQVEKLRNQKRDQPLKHAMAGFFGLILGKVIN